MIICNKCGFGHRTAEEMDACKSWEEMQAEAKEHEKPEEPEPGASPEGRE